MRARDLHYCIEVLQEERLSLLTVLRGTRNRRHAVLVLVERFIHYKNIELALAFGLKSLYPGPSCKIM